MVRWAIKGSRKRVRIRGITSSLIMPFISCGTPGMDTQILPSLSNHIPGAVPRRLGMTVQVSGTSACCRLRSIMGRCNRAKIFLTLSNAPSSTTSLPPKYSESSGFVDVVRGGTQATSVMEDDL